MEIETISVLDRLFGNKQLTDRAINGICKGNCCIFHRWYTKIFSFGNNFLFDGNSAINTEIDYF